MARRKRGKRKQTTTTKGTAASNVPAVTMVVCHHETPVPRRAVPVVVPSRPVPIINSTHSIHLHLLLILLACMPKAPSTRSRSGPVAASTPSLPPNPPPSRSRPHAAAPSWLRTDWSNTAFAIPVFSGSFNSGAQIKWAAKNATVVLHDAFGAGHWDDIIDKPYAVYLAVCDLVLQLYVCVHSVHSVHFVYHFWHPHSLASQQRRCRVEG